MSKERKIDDSELADIAGGSDSVISGIGPGATGPEDSGTGIGGTDGDSGSGSGGGSRDYPLDPVNPGSGQQGIND